MRVLRTWTGRRSGRVLGLVGAAVLAVPGVAAAATTAAHSVGRPAGAAADTPCPDLGEDLSAMNATRAWSAGGQGSGVVVAVVGGAAKAAEAGCSLHALAPQATIQTFTTDGGTAQTVAAIRAARPRTVLLFADTSVDFNDPSMSQPILTAESNGVVVVAAAGDQQAAVSARPVGMITVSLADRDNNRLVAISNTGRPVILASYGPDTSFASGYVAAAAAMLLAAHGDWKVRQVAAQLTGTVVGLPHGHDDQLGFGVMQPLQAAVTSQLDPSQIPDFGDFFPATLPTGPVSSAPSAPASQLAGATATDGGTGGDTAGAVGSPQPFPSAQPDGTGYNGPAPTQVGSAGQKSSSGGGVNPVLVVAVIALLAAGGVVLWRRRTAAPAGPPLRDREEWQPPSGQRHSGYSSPPE